MMNEPTASAPSAMNFQVIAPSRYGLEDPYRLITRVSFSSRHHCTALPLCHCLLKKSLLEGNINHLLNQARSDLMRQEHQVGSLNNCISELQQQAYAQRLELQGSQHGNIESRREQVRLQEELSIKENFLRDTQVRSMHEMGDMKRAQLKLRVDDVSVQ